MHSPTCLEARVVKNRHGSILISFQGLMDFKQRSGGVDATTEKRLAYFLDRFYLSRISLRMIMNQHMMMFGQQQDKPNDRHIGSFDPECSVEEIVQGLFVFCACGNPRLNPRLNGNVLWILVRLHSD